MAEKRLETGQHLRDCGNVPLQLGGQIFYFLKIVLQGRETMNPYFTTCTNVLSRGTEDLHGN